MALLWSSEFLTPGIIDFTAESEAADLPQSSSVLMSLLSYMYLHIGPT